MKNSNRKIIHYYLLFTMLFFIGVGLASIQLVPTVELLKSSNMNASSSTFIFDRFLLPASHLISILIPNYFGNQATYNYWGAGDYIETVTAIGMIPLFFAYLAIFIKFKKDNRLFFLGSFIISIITTLNWSLPKFISTLPIPIISTSPPSRVFAITTFSIAILAGFGFDSWTSYKESLRKLLTRTLPFLLLVFIISIGTFLFYSLKIPCNNEFIQDCRLIGLRNTFLEIFIFCIFLIFFFFYQKTRKQYILSIIIFLILLIGGYNGYKFFPFSEKETILPIHSLITAIKENTGKHRVFGLGEENIKTNFATFFNFYDPNYFDPLHNRRYSELISFANSGTLDEHLSRSDIEITTDLNLTAEKQERRNRLLSILSVTNIVLHKKEASRIDDENIIWQDKNWYLLKNENSLPRVYFVNNFMEIEDNKSILEKLFDISFDPSKSVILEESISSFIKNKPATGKARIINYQENDVEIKTQNENNAILVISDNYFPGWKAYIDRKETKIYRANYTFRAIEVPSGNHKVIFSYNPMSFKTGLALSALSIIIYILVAVFMKKINKKINV